MSAPCLDPKPAPGRIATAVLAMLFVDQVVAHIKKSRDGSPLREVVRDPHGAIKSLAQAVIAEVEEAGIPEEFQRQFNDVFTDRERRINMREEAEVALARRKSAFRSEERRKEAAPRAKCRR